MLRLFLLLSGVVLIVGPIVFLVRGQADIVPPNTILIGILCIAVAEVIRRQDQMERYLKLREIDGDAISISDDLDGLIPERVHEMADKLSRAVSKRVNEPVVIEAIKREQDDYRVMLAIGHPNVARKKIAVIPVKQAGESSAWQGAAAQVLQGL